MASSVLLQSLQPAYNRLTSNKIIFHKERTAREESILACRSFSFMATLRAASTVLVSSYYHY